MAGGVLAAFVPARGVAVVFGLFSLYSAVQLALYRRVLEPSPVGVYLPTRIPLGMGGSFLAGTLSSLLGVGGGPLKVPLMNLGMGVPFKVATATSNFMVGVTALASLLTYAWRGQLPLGLAPPLVIGVFGGSALGTRLMLRVEPRTLRRLFAAVLAAVGLQMLWKGGALPWRPT
jgi:uncharacterized membrane protein YfcA